MNVQEKMEILSGAARYDVSCASSGSRRGGGPGGIGATLPSGVCHSWSADGRCIALLKLLMTNYCIHDCAYCANRVSNDIPRAAFTVEELVDISMNFYLRNYIEGLFLSSGVVRHADHTMDRMLKVVQALRARGFRGYIHMKTIPGASLDLVRRAGLIVDRLSVNIELPTEVSLTKLAPGKRREDILKPMACIGEMWNQNREERRKSRKAPVFSPSGHSTQLIVGASPESDRHILNLSEKLYGKYSLKRVYYSAYVPVNNDSRIACKSDRPDMLREHRLYQADWLVRLYGFRAEEVLDERDEFLDRELDPKSAWALRHFERFPVEVNTAAYEELLRVPGLGFTSAARLVRARRHAAVKEEDLPKLGVIMKRARFFITCSGRTPGGLSITPEVIRTSLLPAVKRKGRATAPVQPELFELAGVL